MAEVKPLEWLGDRLKWINTLELPWRLEYVISGDYERVAVAIERMEIRGAPAIGVAAAFAVALAAMHASGGLGEVRAAALKAIDRLARTRPTAVNLFWALDRMRRVVEGFPEEGGVDEFVERVVREAVAIYEEDVNTNRSIGRVGAEVIEDGDTVLTHCNAGALATAGYGTALGVIRAAWESGKKIKVIATETRPVLQGARLTVWELMQEGIPVTLITDGMVGYVMSRGLVDKVVVGADRVLLSGHVINKIGTYVIAALANRHDVPFYVAAPTSTIDPRTRVEDVVIEERDPDEVRRVLGRLLITVPNVPALNPAFDVTPPELVAGIITERGIARKPFEESLKSILRKSG